MGESKAKHGEARKPRARATRHRLHERSSDEDAMPPRPLREVCVAAAFAMAVSAGAQPAHQLLPIDGSDGVGPRLHLTTTSFLIWAPDLRLVEDLDATPRVTPLALPHATIQPDLGYPFRWTRMSATRVLVAQTGEDEAWGSEDDGVYLLDDLGGANRITRIALGPSPGELVRLDDATAAVVVGLSSGATGTGRLLLLADVGSRNRVIAVGDCGGDHNPPYALSSRSLLVSKPDGEEGSASQGGRYFVSLDDPEMELVELPPLPFAGAPLSLSPTSFLALSRGADGLRSADDVVYLVRDLGGSNERVTLPAPYADEVIARLSPERAILRSSGDSWAYGDADDRVLLLDDLGGTPTVTAIPLPQMKDWIVPVGLGPDLAAVVTKGSDAPSGPDDAVVILSGLGTTNEVTPVAVGPLSNWYSSLPPHLSQPLRLGPGSLILGGFGADGLWPTPDDEVVAVTDAGRANRVDRVVVGDLRKSTVTALPPGAALVLTQGGDSVGGTPDDAVVVLSGIGETSGVQALEVGFLSPPEFWGWVQTHAEGELLGNGRAVFLATEGWVEDYGPSQTRLYLVSGLPGGISLVADEIEIRREPGKGARISATADLLLPDPDLFALADLTIRVGNASQTVPAQRIVRTSSGFAYVDPRGLHGWLRRVEYDAAAGRIEISGRGSGIRAGSTRPRNLILSLESRELQIAQSLDGRRRPAGVRYRRP